MQLTYKQNISRFLEQVIELLTSYQDCKPKCMQVFLKHIRFFFCFLLLLLLLLAESANANDF